MRPIPRFMSQYASWQKSKFRDRKLMRDFFKQRAQERIDAVLRFYEQDQITVDEAMRLISDPLIEFREDNWDADGGGGDEC